MVKINKLLCCLFLVLSAIPSRAETSVWKVNSHGKHLFLAGTIHILSQDEYPLPPEFESAYEQSGIIVFETDIQGLESPEAQGAMIRAVSYGEGHSLQQVLSEETYLLLSSHLETLGIPGNALDPFKPGMVTALITVMELQRLGISAAGVDAYFSGRALAHGKTMNQLETIEEQISFIANMGDGQEDELILSTLSDIEELSAILDEMIRAWRSGNTDDLDRLFISELDQEFPQIYRDLIVKRNNAWFPQIEKMASSEEVELILVGAAHLVGPDGILILLSEKGYEVEKYRLAGD